MKMSVLHGIIGRLHQVVGALAHEIVMQSVKRPKQKLSNHLKNKIKNEEIRYV